MIDYLPTSNQGTLYKSTGLKGGSKENPTTKTPDLRAKDRLSIEEGRAARWNPEPYQVHAIRAYRTRTTFGTEIFMGIGLKSFHFQVYLNPRV